MTGEQRTRTRDILVASQRSKALGHAALECAEATKHQISQTRGRFTGYKFYLRLSHATDLDHILVDIYTCATFKSRHLKSVISSPGLTHKRLGRATNKMAVTKYGTIRSPKPCQRFLKGRFLCILHPKPRNSTFVIESGGVLS